MNRFTWDSFKCMRSWFDGAASAHSHRCQVVDRGRARHVTPRPVAARPVRVRLPVRLLVGLLAGFIGLAMLPLHTMQADPAFSLLPKEAEAIGQTIAQRGGFVRYCAGDASGRWIEASGIRTRRQAGRAELSVNGEPLDARCVYVSEDGSFVSVLDRFKKRPDSQPRELTGELLPSDARTPDAESIARLVFEETNLARTDPASYARLLEAQLPCYRGRQLLLPGRTPILTTEGRRAVDEAIRYLLAARPVKALRWSPDLSLAALDHVGDQGPRGAIGHNGSKGSTPKTRLKRRGVEYSMLAENISYGHRVARDIVLALIVDDGVADRGHRQNLFLASIDTMGVACGPHRTYGWMCVQDFVQSR